MSVRQDRFTFFGVLIAVVIVVLGYLQLGQLYPVAGRAAPAELTTDEPDGSIDEPPTPEELDTTEEARSLDPSVHEQGDGP